MKEPVQHRRIISIAGAFIGFCIGAAFATGQEVLQFFTAYGFLGIAGAFLSSGLYMYMCISFLRAGRGMPAGDGNGIFRYYAGETIGRLFEWYSVLFLYIVMIIMMSGAGAVFSDYYGLSAIWGRLAMGILAVLAVVFGLKRLVTVLAPLGPLVIIGCVAVALLGLWKNGGNLSAAQAFIENTDMVQASGSFWLSGILHATFMAALLAVFTASLGTTVTNKREATMGGLLGGMGFGVGILVVLFVELAYVEEIAFSDVPMLYIANQLGIPAVAPLFSFILLAGIFSTTAPLLWSVSVRFTRDNSLPFRLLSVALTAVAFLASYMPFQRLVNLVLPTSGYVGMVFMLLMVFRQVRGRALFSKTQTVENIRKETTTAD